MLITRRDSLVILLLQMTVEKCYNHFMLGRGTALVESEYDDEGAEKLCVLNIS